MKDPNVASVVPTSKFGVRRICGHVDPSADRVVVEYGPGTGVITRELLARLSPGSRLIVIEQNKELAKILGEIDDPRLRVFHDDAANVREILQIADEAHVDYVISGIPFSFLTPDERRNLVQVTHDLLSPDGHFIVYQAKDMMKSYIRAAFLHIETDFEPLNFPPLFIFDATK
jgi:phospholipid N-methyltransferase